VLLRTSFAIVGKTTLDGRTVHMFTLDLFAASTAALDLSDVLRLIARGLSNVEIADRLYLAHTTVKSYVANIPSMLGVQDRVRATVAAYESGPVRPGNDRRD
jgi:DNA-binding CsgD family transcriptional regulator